MATYKYRITIRFSASNTNLPGTDISVNAPNHYQDKFHFKRSSIVITAERNTIIPDTKIDLFGNDNNIHIQMEKAIIYYCLTSDSCVKISNIIITRQKVGSKNKVTYSNTNTYEQPFPIRSHNKVPFDKTHAQVVFRQDRVGHFYRIALSYWLREQYSLHPFHQFELLWKSFNCVYCYVSNQEQDSTGVNSIIHEIRSNPHNYSQSIADANGMNLATSHLDWKGFLWNTLNRCGDDTKPFNRGENCKISKLIKQFNKADIKSIFNPIVLSDPFVTKMQTYDAERSVRSHLMRAPYNVQTDSLTLLIRYCYFMRNTYFHATVKEQSFSLCSDKAKNYIGNLNKILESLLIDLFYNTSLRP